MYMYLWYMHVAYWVGDEESIEYIHSPYNLPKTNPRAHHVIA